MLADHPRDQRRGCCCAEIGGGGALGAAIVGGLATGLVGLGASLRAMGLLGQRRSGGCAGDRGCQPKQTAAVSPKSACHAAGASACCAASGRPDAGPVHTVHARAACFANFDNDVVRLLQGGATRHGVNR